MENDSKRFQVNKNLKYKKQLEFSKLNKNDQTSLNFKKYKNFADNKICSVSTEINSKNNYTNILSNLKFDYFSNHSDLIEIKTEESEYEIDKNYLNNIIIDDFSLKKSSIFSNVPQYCKKNDASINLLNKQSLQSFNLFFNDEEFDINNSDSDDLSQSSLEIEEFQYNFKLVNTEFELLEIKNIIPKLFNL